MENEQLRSIMILGKTGAGKSKVLNELMGEQLFSSLLSTESCTEKVESKQKIINFISDNQTQETSFELRAFDTPGIADSQGRSKRFLNEIAQTIKTQSLNVIIILVEYGRLDISLHNNLEILREYLNDVLQSSSMLIINKVPTVSTLDRLRKKGEIVRDRKEDLDEIFKKISDILGISFTFKFFLENDIWDHKTNVQKYNQIREAIFNCDRHLNASKVRTWDEIVKFYDEKIIKDETIINKMNALNRELNNLLHRVEFEIADIKYPFLKLLDSKHILLARYRDFVFRFECALTEEDYLDRKNSKTNAFLFGIMRNYYVFYMCYNNVHEKLTKLDAKRSRLNGNLSESINVIEKRRKDIEINKAFIFRLENALVNPNMIQTSS